MKNVAALLLCVCLIGIAQAATFTSQVAAPNVGIDDIAQLSASTSDTDNINGTTTGSGDNDASTYVAGDRGTQGQTFLVSEAGTVGGIWVQHVNYPTYLSNGTWYNVWEGAAVTVRISSVSGTELTVLGSEVATVAAGSSFVCAWNSADAGTGKWLYFDLATPVALSGAGLYAFDLTSIGGPFFELAGLKAGTYADGNAYSINPQLGGSAMTDTYADGDRTFVVNMVPEPATMLLLGLGGLLLRRKK